MKTFINIILVFTTSLLYAQYEPYWVSKLPYNPDYYIGIGVATIEVGNDEYLTQAKNSALNDIASSIMITISSSYYRNIVERLGVIEDDFRSKIQTKTSADLEGYEIVGTWKNDKQYWIYIRLSKEHYEQLKSDRLENALSMTRDYFIKARDSQEKQNLERALFYYLQALRSIDNYVHEPLTIQYNNKDILLNNEIFSEIHSILSNISLLNISKL